MTQNGVDIIQGCGLFTAWPKIIIMEGVYLHGSLKREDRLRNYRST